MKRILSCFLSAAILLSLCGCGNARRVQELESQVEQLSQQVQALQSQLAESEPQESAPQIPESPSPSDVQQETVPYSEMQPGTSSVSGNPQAEQIRAEISTFKEAIAWLDARFPELWMSAHLNDGISDLYWLDSGENIVCRDPQTEVAGRSCIVNAITYLLSDDMEIYTVLGFWHDETGGCPLKAVNCIRTKEGYWFLDPVDSMYGNKMSAYGAPLPQGLVDSPEEYTQMVLSDPELLGTLDSLYMFRDGSRIDFTQNQAGWVTLITPPAQELYINKSNYISDEDYHQQRFAHVIPENIGSYAISDMLGGLTLSPQEAKELVDADPETIKQKVRTAGDLLMYMLAAQIGDNGGCYCDSWDGYTWHTNFTAKEVMEKKLSNCGACSNLANYLLEDDYEQIGFILHAYYPGNGGGHVYNYIKHQGKYYIVDYSWYIFANYEPGSDFPVKAYNSLADYGKRVNELYEGVSLVLSHESTGRHLPNIFGEEFGDNHYYVPQGAHYTLLYQSTDGYQIGEMPFNKKYYNWDLFW